MELTKLKLYATSAIIGLAVLPKGIYHVSNFYIEKYTQTTEYLSYVKTKSLNSIGLTEIKPDSNLSLIIESAAKEYSLHKNLLHALIKHESAENADALSLKSAIGYSQIMPDNYKRCGLNKKSELWDTEKNIRCGARILSEELATYKGDLRKALRAYNGGPKCVSGGCSESERHSADIMARFAQSSVNG